MFKKFKKKLSRYKKKYNSKIAITPPHIGNIELTNKCPFSCIMCIRTYSMDRKQGFMDYELYKKILDDLVQYNPHSVDKELSFTHFGESMMHEEFHKFIKYAKDKGYKHTLLSINPYMLTDDNIEKVIASEIDILHISLDGHDNESFQKIRGGGENWYEMSKERLINFLEIKAKRKLNIYVRLGMINFNENAKSILEMSQFWKGFDNIEEVQTKKFTHWSGVSDEVVKLHEDFEPSKRDKSYVACTQPWWNLTVLWDGRVVPCCGDVNGIYEYGNLQTSTLEEIWNNEKIQSLRKSFLENKVSNPLCKNCEYLYE